jgi:uncharacterized protein (DUF1501 family)
MFSLLGGGQNRTCQTITRRELLRVGSLALGGLTLPGLLAGRSAASQARHYVRNKSVVFLFLQGGPSQIETFDPKMTAPQDIRSINGEVATRIPGVTFGSTFERLAGMAHRLAVVRSFASGNNDHQNYVAVAGGDNPLRVPMTTLYSRVAGANRSNGMPTGCVVTPEATGPDVRLGSNFETQALQKLLTAGMGLGATYAPFDPSSGGELRRNLQLQLPRDRFDDRRGLLAQLDTFKQRMDRTRTFDNISVFEQQAYEVIVRGISDAFDLSREDQRTIARYDTSGLFTLSQVHRWGDMRRSSNLLGKQLLLARRLCEAGCGFVTVFDAGWDMHANNNSPRNMEGLNWLGRQVDHAVSAFLEDVEERGLSDDILLVITGEMGRTPKLNRNGGRDHWGNLTPLVLAGGGLRMGQVIGQSDRQAGNPVSERYTPRHLLATIMQTLFDVGEVRVARDLPANVVDIVSSGTPIRELF